MKILVTGGAGFIGSSVVRVLIDDYKFTVINVDKLTYAGNVESLVEFKNNPQYIFEQVDICSREGITRVLDQYKPDKVMHLAAESHVDRSIDGPGAFIETNIVGTNVLLDAARFYWKKLSGEKARRLFCAILDEVRPNFLEGISSYAELIEFFDDRPGHDLRYAIDARKIKNELGWEPKESFQSGLRKTLECCLNNKAWWTCVQNCRCRGECLGLGGQV